jgi:hypothetical protein
MSDHEFSDDPDIRGMHRQPDWDTSIEAAEATVWGASTIRELIHRILCEQGDMTDEAIADELALRGFDLAESTPRKRRGELVEVGRVVATEGRERNRRGRDMVIWHGIPDGQLPIAVDTGGFVPSWITDRIEGHEGDQP